jgi:anti-sigma factor RsiW
MKCPMESHENAELLLAYCARRLDPETQTVLERHMTVCPACREFQAGQQAVWNALDAWEAMPVAADFNRRLYRRIAEEEARASWWSRLTRPFQPMFAGALVSRGVPAAAAICLLVLAGVVLERPATVAVPDEVTADARIESIQPDQVERTLDDMEMLRQLRITPANESGALNAM